MEVKDDIQLKCISCGHTTYFEPNYDRSYIMCMYCHREYKGGYEELYLLNEKKAASNEHTENSKAANY